MQLMCSMRIVIDVNNTNTKKYSTENVIVSRYHFAAWPTYFSYKMTHCQTEKEATRDEAALLPAEKESKPDAEEDTHL